MSETDRLEGTGIVLATFTVQQDKLLKDTLKDANIGAPIMLTGNGEVGPIIDSGQLFGKLIALTLKDGEDGDRLATVQIGGICRLAISPPYPKIGNRVLGGTLAGTVSQAPVCYFDRDAGWEAGGDNARGTVLDVNGTIDCFILLN